MIQHNKYYRRHYRDMRKLATFNLLAVSVAAISLQHPFLSDSDEFFPHIRDLKLGQLNFLHTTDTHGWLGSHLLQPDYDADWGDFVSFVSEFKEKRLGEDQDLLVIDTGDKHDGNGLTDATSPNGVDVVDIFNEQDYDLMTLGNHELYLPENSILEYKTATSAKFKDKYVSSNVEFINDDGEVVPFGNKYLYFETEKTKIRILAFSFMFNFRRFNERANVVPPMEEVAKDWFKEVTGKYNEDQVDLILIFGHMPVTDFEDNEMYKLHRFFRSIYPRNTIQYFGGHSHIRDFAVFDEKATGLQSGRFAETLGFLSIDNVTSEAPYFFRRYIDFNRRSFEHHLGENSTGVKSSKGHEISNRLKDIRERLKLDEVIGYVPQTYYMSARPLHSEDNLYHLITHKVLPQLHSNVTDFSIGRYVMINTGAVRYDLYEGPFTADSEYIVLPFANEWRYMELPNRIASKIEQYLNKGPSIASLAPPNVVALQLTSGTNSCPFIKNPKLTEGYTTTDDAGCKGDDTKHNSQRDYYIPNVVQHARLVSKEADDLVHFIFYSFLQPPVLQAVNAIVRDTHGPELTYDDSSCKNYGGNSTKELLRTYISNIDK